MKTTRLEDELLLIAQVEMALDKVPNRRPSGIAYDLRRTLINAYIRERRWTVAFFASVLANVVLFAEVFM